MLPRFPDETDALPQFSLDLSSGPPDAERTLEYRALGPSDLELIDEERSTPPSIVPVALEASDLEEELEEREELGETIVLPRRTLPWRAMSIGVAAMAALALGWLASSSTSPGDRSTVAAALAPLPKLPVELPAPPPAPVVETPPPAPPPTPTTGTILTPKWAKGRRVWLDGKPLPGHAPKLEAACGKHSVRIGAYGKTRKVEIPCGGELTVAP